MSYWNIIGELQIIDNVLVDAVAIGGGGACGGGGGSCCVKKTVGGVAYTLVSEDDTTKYGCKENCIYTRDDQPGGTQICFRAGDLESVCNPDKDGNNVPYMDKGGTYSCNFDPKYFWTHNFF